jgi:type I restriction enzyme S subunit
MTLKTFFEKFDQFADAPDAVAKMRELVLELAMRGHLVQSDKPSPSAKPGLLGPFPLPNHWRWSALSEAVDCRASAKVSPASISDSDWVLDLEDIDGTAGKIVQTVTFAERRSLSTKAAFERGDVLYGKLRPYLNKVVIATKAGFCTTEIIPLRPGVSLSPEFLRFYLRSKTFLNYAAQKNYGMKMPRLGTKDLESAAIPLPPIAEQKRIVTKVHELMALCDRLEAQQQQRQTRHADIARASLARFAAAPTPANLNLLFHSSFSIHPSDLRKSILTLAVQGKLVPQDPKDEPAIRVLERIDAAPKRAMRTRGTDEGETDESIEFEPLFELPPGWEWAPFRRLPLHASVGLDRGRSMQGPDKAVGYFKMNNIRNSGGVDLSDLTRIDATPDEIEGFALADGDFLFNTRNSRELVGKTCVFRAPSDDPILNNNNILRVKFIEGFSPDFLDYWFRSPEGSAELEKLKSNTTNVCAIYQGKLSGFPCVVPPLAEQRRIVAKVDQLMALVDELETQLAASRATAKNLLEALVAELTAA